MYLYIIIIILAYFLYKSFCKKTENLTNDTKKEISAILKAYINANSNFVDYLKVLTANKNTSYNLLKQDTFFELKFLAKQNKLTEDIIISYMSDV